MSNPLVQRFGHVIDFGPCQAGRNLNLLVFRGFAGLESLAAISAPDVYDAYSNPSGTQRELDKRHASSCFLYASTADGVLAQDDPRSFPEIILNARDEMTVELYQVDDPDFLLALNSFTSDAEYPGGIVGVRVRVGNIDFPTPTKNPQISRVDGNHRLSGVDLDSLLASEDDLDPIPVPFSLYIGLTTEQEVKLFKDINGEHKGMDVTHLTNIEVRLDGDALKNNPARRHNWLADRLAQPDRAFEGMVFFGGARRGAKEALGKVPPVKLNTLASAIKLQLSKASIMTARFDEKPDLILELLDRYWKAVRSVFVEEWSNKSDFILLQTIGLNGFATLGATLLDQGINEGKVEQSDFEAYLKAVRADVNLSRTSDEWRGVAGAGGAARVAEVLIKAATSDAANVIKVVQALDPGSDPAAVLD